MQRPKLAAEERTILGKKVRKLRREGLLPANVYGKELNSLAVQVKMAEFQTVFKEVGETGLVDLVVNNETRPVLVKNLQMDFRTHTPLHVDFYQVNLKEKVKTMVPLEFVGEAKAVTDKLGLFLPQITEVEVEALPEALPENIEINVEHLALVDEQILVSDLKVPEGVTLLTDEAQTVAKIGELVVEEPEPEVVEGEEGVEGEAGAEGEAEATEGGEEKPSEGGENEEKSSEEKSE